MTHVTETAAWDRRFGGFARMYPRPTAQDLAAALADAGLVQVQLNLNALGLPTIPAGADLEGIDFPGLAATFAEHGLSLWGLSATYNMAHPDPAIRRAGTEAAAAYIAAIPHGVATAATLCTGSRDAENLWRAHPDNGGEAAWNDFRAELDLLLEAADSSDLVLGIEPEPGNVVADADAAVRLIRELGTDAASVGFILDPANLVSARPRTEHAAVLEDAFDRLGERAVCIHVKDAVPWVESLHGGGVVDYRTVVRLSAALPDPVPLIIQDATEDQVPEILRMLRAAVHTAEGAR